MVGFGEPLSLRAFVESHRGEAIEGVGEALRDRIREVIPVLPVPLIAWLMQRAEGPMTREALSAAAAPHLAHMLHPTPGLTVEAVVEDGIAGLTTRRILSESAEGLVPNPENRVLLEYYARSIEHLLDADAA